MHVNPHPVCVIRRAMFGLHERFAGFLPVCRRCSQEDLQLPLESGLGIEERLQRSDAFLSKPIGLRAVAFQSPKINSLDYSDFIGGHVA